MIRQLTLLFLGLSVISCGLKEDRVLEEPYLMVLGNVQDAGSPQAGCRRSCCAGLAENPDPYRRVSSLAYIDRQHESAWIYDATPDFPAQWADVMREPGFDKKTEPNGIFLTHAHIGHYTGLMYLGKEAWNTRDVSVYGLPRMLRFLETQAPWNALTDNKNILLEPLDADTLIWFPLGEMTVRTLLVPHRDEFSETACFIIRGPNRIALYLPDIDKWEKWAVNIDSLIATVDYAFLDGTFYDSAEIGHRDIRTIPHPFICESMERFADLPDTTRNRIHFIHLNHTNPALDPRSEASATIEKAGFHVARYGMRFPM